jgi:hypothetical protein
MKKVLLSSFLLCLSAAPIQAQQNWDSSPNNPKNSIYNYNNSPNNWKNSPHNPANSTADFKNSPNNYANSPNNPNSYNVYDDKGKRVGWYARNSNGVLVYFNADGKVTPRPTAGGAPAEPDTTPGGEPKADDSASPSKQDAPKEQPADSEK